MPGSVSGSNGANPYISAGWKQASPALQQLGLDSKYSTQIGNILNGNVDGMITDTTNGIVDGLISNPVANAAVKGAIDIVKTVLMGNYNKGEDIKEAQQDLTNIDTTGKTSNQLADAGKKQCDETSTNLKSDLDESKTTVENATDTITNVTDTTSTQVEDLAKGNEEKTEQVKNNQEVIEQNNEEIKSKQQKVDELSAKIVEKKEELGNNPEPPAAVNPQPATPEPARPQPPAADDSSIPTPTQVKPTNKNQPSGETTTQMSSDNVQDPELQGLIQQYNNLGADISKLSKANTTLTESNKTLTEEVQTNVETANDSVVNTIEVTEEQSASIDDATNSIVSMCKDAESAVGEVKKLLQGQFPKLDKVTLVKLATSMTKSAICGTNSGLLAAAAAAFGVSSIFTFGASAQKAAELTAASVDQGAGSLKHIATNVAGKLIQQQMTSYMNQTLSNIGQMIGVDLSQLQSSMMEYVQEKSNESNSAIESFKQLKNETTIPLSNDEKKPNPPATGGNTVTPPGSEPVKKPLPGAEEKKTVA